MVSLSHTNISVWVQSVSSCLFSALKLSFGLASSARFLSAVEGVWTFPACQHLPAVSWHTAANRPSGIWLQLAWRICSTGHQATGKKPWVGVLGGISGPSSSYTLQPPMWSSVQAHPKQWPQRAEAPHEDLEKELLPHCVFLCNPKRGGSVGGRMTKVPFSHPLAPLGRVSTLCIWSAETEFLRWAFIMIFLWNLIMPPGN